MRLSIQRLHSTLTAAVTGSHKGKVEAVLACVHGLSYGEGDMSGEQLGRREPSEKSKPGLPPIKFSIAYALSCDPNQLPSFSAFVCL